ncbi:MAG: DUF2207 domain-containing protein [Anaerolineae bacterium]|nr:DUF2207 domain-containing protein [Thermoflexales bacterium]MDW8408330.1 DUF2207 domain-containing protein [Anaerolineae bacterium]
MSYFACAAGRSLTLLIMLWFAVLGRSLEPAQAQTKSIRWLRLDVHIVVLNNGDLQITETNVIQFIGGPFTFGYRDIDTARLERIFDVEAMEDDRPLRLETGYLDNGRFRIQYFFPPTVNQTRTLTLRYTVSGATRYYLAGDQVWWVGVYADRNGFPVEASRLTVQLPPGALAERVETYGPPATITDQGEGRVVAEAQTPIPSGQEFEIRVQFPHHIISGEAPAWQRAFDERRAYEENVKPRNNLIFLALALISLFGGPAFLAVWWYVRGRDLYVPPIADYLNEPPPNLPAGMAGTLIDERADLRDVIATLADLAERGVLRVREEGWQKWFIERGPNFQQPLRRFEQTMIEALGLARRTDSVALDKRRQVFYRYIPQIKSDLYDQLIADGYYARSPEEMRASHRRAAQRLFIAAAAWVPFSALFLRDVADTAIWLSLSLAVNGLALLLIASAMPVRTRKGAEARMRLVAFKRYLSNVEKYVDVQAAVDQFNRYLPYAIAFGLEHAWINRFAAVNTPAPTWFAPRRRPWETPADPTLDPLPAWRSTVEASSTSLASPSPVSGATAERLDVSSAARAPTEMPSLAAVNQSLTDALSRVNTDLINMFSSAAVVFDSRPPSPTVTALKDFGASVSDWMRSAGSSDDDDNDRGYDGWRSSSSGSSFGGWSGGGRSAGGGSGGGGGGFG